MKSHPAKSCPSCGERYDADVLFCPKDGTPLASTRNPSIPGTDRDPYMGIQLDGQIQLKHLIGIGSMGRVYRAFQSGIERDVAVKILHRELSANADLVSRFHREAKVASRLVHPNVVQVLMTGSLPSASDAKVGGELYLVMEYLDGISLLSALAAAGNGSGTGGAALPLARALHIALQICDAVGEAHAQGIVHRDLKPENIMLVRRGEDPDYVKVLDFGIARLEWGSGSMATQAGLIFGTAKYISPEGAEGLAVGPTADVYAIATILYQCLAGRTPFEGESPVALLVQHTHAPPPELRTIARASYVPSPLAAVIMQALSKNPAERPATARLFGRELVAASRMSGLDPDEIASSSTLLRKDARGVVKLASKERTKALELSPELAARIGGVAARPSDPTPLPGETVRSPSAPAISVPRPVSPTLHDEAPPSARTHAGASFEEALRPPPSAPRSQPLPLPLPPRRAQELDFEDSPPPEGSVGLPFHSTLQGTESTSRIRLPRARIARAVAIVACAAAAALIVVLGGMHYGGFGAAASNDSVEANLDAARECVRRHAWDSPPQHNVKDITDSALQRWPGDARVLDLRREAAERLVTDALGRKYAGDSTEALHLAKLALEFHPPLTTAQHLVAELEEARTPAVAPAVDAGVDERPGSKPRKGPREPRVGADAGATPAASTTPATRTSASADAGSSGALLPPSPPALPKDHTPPSPPSTGPWL